MDRNLATGDHTRVGIRAYIDPAHQTMAIKLGCIADDFTGATDIALLIKQAGYSVVQTIGLPDCNYDIPDVDAVVVALKSRTVEPHLAVQQSLSAHKALLELGMQQCFFKYCSTFDSTSHGNIGPVSDGLLKACGADIAIACPAFPVNGRTVYMGHLFVHQQLLSESPMRDHPLTPMTDANLVRVLKTQSQYQVGLIDVQQVESGSEVLCRAFEEFRSSRTRLVIVDALSNQHLETIGKSVIDHRLVTGGSALGAYLVRARIQAEDRRKCTKDLKIDVPDGASAVLAGSCSQATLQQIEYASGIMPAMKLDLDSIAQGQFDLDRVLAWTGQYIHNGPVLIYASESAEQRAQQRIDSPSAQQSECLGERIENAFATLTPALVEQGVRHFVVAGGETSGAVTRSLGVKVLQIGDEIDPGVPWTLSDGDVPVALALKSGNFGGREFFVKALRIIGK
ncbi:MAG: 3-oxo-tetronate kinase [bacterium]